MFASEADLVIRLVFPTLWSPSNTILVRFGGVEEKSAVAGVDNASIVSVRLRVVVESSSLPLFGSNLLVVGCLYNKRY